MDAFHTDGPTIQTDGILPIHTQRPGHDLQRQHQHRMQEKMSDSEEDGDSDFDDFDESTSIMNLNPAYGQTVALWSFTKNNNIAIFPSDSYDLIGMIMEYAEEHLDFKRFEHQLMLLYPGQLSPVKLKSVYSIRPGSVVMVMPEDSALLTIEISQLKTSFSLTADLAMTVHKLKSYIRKRKGIPVDRQEILFSNKALENNRRLLEYRVKNRSTLYVMIQAHFDLLINVETFWGKTYRFYLDPCSTGSDIVHAVFNRAFSANGPEDAGLHELYVPTHVLVLLYQNKFVNWDYCIAYLGIHTGDKLVLTTVGHHSNMKLETVNVVTETGDKYSITISQYDRWSVLAFMLHGLTNVPVDLIRLYINGKRVDFSSVIGELERHQVILMNVVMTLMDNDLVFGVPLKISIGNGITENVKISANKSVRSLKKKLERMGVPNATLYELTIGNQKLPNSSKIIDLHFDLKIPLVLKLETFPVFAHAPDGVIYKTYLPVNQTIGNFKHKIELKTGYSLKSSQLLIAGKEIEANPQSVLYEAGVSCRNSIFIKYTFDIETFFVVGNPWLEKLKIPSKPNTTDIRNAVWNAKKLSEGSLNSVLTILYWFFMPRIAITEKSKLRIKKRMPVTRETLFEMEKNKNSQHFLEKNKSKATLPNTADNTGTSWRRTKTYNIPKFEPDQYIDSKEIRSAGRENWYHGNKQPNQHEMQKSTIPSWMTHLQSRNKTNRLITTDVEGGPKGMTSVHQSRSQLIKKKIDARMTEKTQIPTNLDTTHVQYRANHNDNLNTNKRFRYDHQHFNFVASEYGE